MRPVAQSGKKIFKYDEPPVCLQSSTKMFALPLTIVKLPSKDCMRRRSLTTLPWKPKHGDVHCTPAHPTDHPAGPKSPAPLSAYG